VRWKFGRIKRPQLLQVVVFFICFTIVGFLGLQFLQADFFVPMRFQQKSERVFLKIFNNIFTF